MREADSRAIEGRAETELIWQMTGQARSLSCLRFMAIEGLRSADSIVRDCYELSLWSKQPN